MHKYLVPIVVLALLVQAPAAHANANDPPSADLALELYVEGLRTGNLAKLQKLFLAEGQFCARSTEPARGVVCRRFDEVLPSWIARPDPQASGRIMDRRLAAPSMMSITYELQFGGTRYVDQLLMYEVEGRWLVVAKTTTAQ